LETNFTFIDLFAGIGGIRIPFEEIGGKCVFSSESDKYAQDTYEANFGERPFGDLTKIAINDIPSHDILLAGFPCQAFSIMGKGLGFADTRGTLFFEIERILKAKKPKAFLLENVKRLVSHDNKNTFRIILQKLDNLGYNVSWKIMNALDYGLPQKRERVIIVGFRESANFIFPEAVHNHPKLQDFLESHDKVDKKYFASDMISKKRLNSIEGKKVPTPAIWHENKSGNIGIHEYSCALRAGASYNYLLVDGIRRLSTKECLNLQGFPKDFKIYVPDIQIRKQVGNSVPINLIREVGKQMIKVMDLGSKKDLEQDICA
jgi:DNA (cytosine-5)-methyltransferase 1